MCCTRRWLPLLGPLLAAVLTCGPAGAAPGFLLPDSDQRTCYEGVWPCTVVPCAGTGQDGAYVHNPLSYADNGNGTVTDRNTGLVWQKKDDGTLYNWYEATGAPDPVYNPDGISACGSFGRLPSKKELLTLVNFAVPYPGPTISTAYFPGARASSYWTSTTAAAPADSAWYAWFGEAKVTPAVKCATCYVRCVRGGYAPAAAPPPSPVADTVTDTRTGLVWQQGEPGLMTWGSALAYCESLDLGGSTAWRLPNVKELESIVDDTRWNPAVDTALFPGVQAASYWSSTSIANVPYYVYSLDFTYGYVSHSGKDYELYTRCVHGGLAGSGTTRFPSRGAQDGWILESAATSESGGAVNAGATTIRLGDDLKNRQYLGILSFDTQGLPDTAVVTAATLSFKKQGVVGTDPLTTHGELVGDIATGVFGTAATLQPSDFQAAAGSTAAIASFTAAPGGWYAATFDENARLLVNTRGRTQVRVRFESGDDADGGADYLQIFSGNASAAQRPVLEVTYTVTRP
jgi:hypothetical protein